MRRLRPLRHQAEAVTVADELAKIGAIGAHEIVEVAQSIGRSTRLKKAMRVVGFGILGLWVVLSALLVAGQYFIRDALVLEPLTKVIEQQTGGKFVYEKGDFSLLGGLALKGVALYPPLDGDARGYTNGGGIAREPMLTMDELRVDLGFYRLFYGRLDLGAVHLIKPNIQLEQNPLGFTAVNAINAYRLATLPTSAPTAPVSPSKEFNVRDLFPIAPASIFLPFSAHASFAVDHLALLITDVATKRQTKVSGFDANVAFAWLGRSSALDVKLGGTPLSIVTPGLEFSDHLAFDVNLKDFTDLRVNMTHDKLAVHQGPIALDDLGVRFGSEFMFSPSYDAVTIKSFKLLALDALNYELTGDLSLPNGTLDLVRLKLKHEFALDLFSLTDVLQKIVPDLAINGHISTDALMMQGDLEPSQLASGDLKVPFINGSVNFVDMRADSQALGVLVKPINGHIALGAGPALNGVGSQLDLSSDFELGGAKVTALTSAGKQEVDIGTLSTRLVSRLRFPKAELPFFRLNMHADHVQGFANDVLVADVPFDLDLIGDFREAFAKASANLRVELPQLLELSGSLICSVACSTARLDSSLNLRSMAKILALTRPSLQKFLSLKDIPEQASGNVDFRLSARGENLSFGTTVLSAKQNLSVEGLLNIQDFGLNLPLRGLSLRGFNHRMTLAADSVQQALSLTQSISELSFTPRGGDPLSPALIQAYELRADVKNVSNDNRDHNLIDAIAKGDSALNFSMTVGTAGASSYFPRNLKDISASGALKREGFRFVNVEKLGLSLPDFGFSSDVALQTFLDQAFKPYGVKASIRAGIEHGEETLLLSGVKTKGRAMIDLALNSISQDLVRVDGAVDFLNFFIDIPKQDKPSEPMLRVDAMNGYVPLQQVLSRSQWLNRQAATTRVSDGSDLNAAIEAFFARSDNTIFDLQNKTSEVDYPEVRPFYRDRRPISIEKVRAANLEARNIEFDIELKQNWLSVNQFALEFLGGKIQGDTHVAFDTAPLALKTSVHLTRLDSRKLVDGFPKLRKKAGGFSLLSDPYVDASVHLNVNLRANDFGGDVEVTSIGKEQLRMMLFYVDPNQEDPTMSQLRSALNFGEVKQVSIPIKNGFVGIDVDLRLLATPIPTPQIRGFPIAQLIANYKSQASMGATSDQTTERSDANVEAH